jgi:hypothetical protein
MIETHQTATFTSYHIADSLGREAVRVPGDLNKRLDENLQGG